MKLNEFIGQVVISARSGRRFKIEEITAPEIGVVSESPDSHGYFEHYVYRTINGDPISDGSLLFENPALTEPFKAAFKAYSHTMDARVETYFYWLLRD